MTKCLLCQSVTVQAIVGGHHCASCDLIFKDPSQFLDFSQQKLRYDTHNNDAGDQGYLESLNILWAPLKTELKARKFSQGLDWGSGPNPVLAQTMNNDGFSVEIYDPVYSPEKKCQKFEFITSTEVIEHFTAPREELAQIFSQLKPGGIFAGLTRFHPGPEKFSQWWYQRDNTHFVFYSEKTFQFLAEKFNLKLIRNENPIFIFERSKELLCLETERLLLRPFNEKDLENLYALDSDPEVMKYISQGKPSQIEDVEKILAKVLERQKLLTDLGTWAAVEKASGNFIGWFTLKPLPELKNQVEVGYRLLKKYWGQGFATEGTKYLLKYGFETVGLEKIVGITHPENQGSKHVLTKAGLKAKGTIPSPFTKNQFDSGEKEVCFFELVRK